MYVPKQASRAMTKEEEATGETKGQAELVTTTRNRGSCNGPAMVASPLPVHVLPFAVVWFPFARFAFILQR